MIIILKSDQTSASTTRLKKSHQSCTVQARTREVIRSQNQAGKKKFMSKNEFGYWNDRRSRRVFLCFYSAIFQLTSAKFQTFAYNSRTVGSSYIKFGQQFEINGLYICTKFRGNRSRDFGFRTRKPPRKFGVKSGLSQKRLKYGKKYFSWLYVSRYPFIPPNPLLAAMRFISFFFFSS